MGIHVPEKRIWLPPPLILLLVVVNLKAKIKFGFPSSNIFMKSPTLLLTLSLVTADAFVKPVQAVTGQAFINGDELRLAIETEEYDLQSSVYGHPITDWDVSGMLLPIY
jgi:hypothetical protein